MSPSPKRASPARAAKKDAKPRHRVNYLSNAFRRKVHAMAPSVGVRSEANAAAKSLLTSMAHSVITSAAELARIAGRSTILDVDVHAALRLVRSAA